MKLELKHLVSYLSYGLNIKDVKYGSVFDALHFITTTHQDFSLFKGNLDQLINDEHLKLILYPLESLTKTLKEMYSNYGSDIVVIGMKNSTIVNYRLMGEFFSDTIYQRGFDLCPNWVFQKLLEKKIDVFGLIDAGLAEPVTEDFNPYK